MGLVVGPEIQALIPPRETKETEYLEGSLRAYGCRNPLKVWRRVLLDGHRRLDFCKRHRIPYEIEQVDLPDRETALLWVEQHQLARHDLADDQRAALAVR